ncbi:MAG: ROK family protein [Clostridia bacterium]|nr:ROK family protein [Clostridia bacterium]
MRELYGGVDVGGTKIMTGLIDGEGKVLSYDVFPTEAGADGVRESVKRIARQLAEQCAAAGTDISALRGIGLGSAGPVDPALGTIENPYTLPGWEHYPIVAELSRLTGCPCRLDNDANGMLMGEVMRRNLWNRNVLMITFGTGIGTAVFRKGGLYRANGRYHPEMGHVIVADDGPECYCGHRGCFESLCSGTAMNRMAAENGYDGFAELYTAWKTGADAKAEKLMRKARRRIANGIYDLMIVFKPDELVIGGGFGRAYFDLIREIAENDLKDLTDFVVPFEISCADDNGTSAVIGAAGILKIYLREEEKC